MNGSLFTDYTIKVHAHSGRDEVIQKTETRFEVFTIAPAQNNLANLTIIKMMSEHFHVPQKQVFIVRGSTTPNKTVRVYQG